ncbi:MAG TPA: hypothetical protein VFM31_01690 [Nitrososphaeraceae archaeon]|jgi:hypothetical protein|nr:hypothetical protein [Nitrososphaeraceae archaeon]
MTGISEHKTKAASAAADEYLNLLLSLEGKTKEEITYFQELTIGIALALLPEYNNEKILTPDENLQIVEHIVKPI